MFKKDVKKHGKLKKGNHKKIKEIEKALFDLDEIADTADKPLKTKSHKSHAKQHPSHHTKKERKTVTVRYNPRTVERIISAIVLIVLLIFFFYNPFYDMFPWNKDSDDIEVEEIAIEEEEETEVEEEVELVLGDEEEEEETEAEVEEEVEEEVVEEEEEETEVNETSVNETTGTETEGTDAELGEVTFEIIDVKTEKTDWGWKIREVSFKVDNNRANFRPKVRVRSLAESVTGDQHGDQVKVLPILAIGKSLTDSVDARSSFVSDIEQAYIIVKLSDEGTKTGMAGDTSLKEIRQKVNAP